MAGRFIKLYEQITKWGWYQNGNTFRLFIHLLLKANFDESVWEGMPVHRGQVVTSVNRLSKELKLSVREIRTALTHLISTNEVTTLSFTRYTVITIVKYDEFQSSTRLSTNERQTSDKQATNDRQHHKNNIEDIEEQEIIEDGEAQPKVKRFVPPTKEEILDYCLEEKLGVDVDRLYDYYSSKGWKVGSSPMKDWKAAVRNWDRRDKERKTPTTSAPVPVKTVPAQQYEQRDYGDEDAAAMQRQIEMIRRMQNG